jgi:hypothetical protein
MNVFKRIRYWYLTLYIKKQEDLLKEVRANIVSLRKSKFAHFEAALQNLLDRMQALEILAQEQILLDRLHRDDIVEWRHTMLVRLKTLQVADEEAYLQHLEKRMHNFADEAGAFIDDYNKAHPDDPV